MTFPLAAHYVDVAVRIQELLDYNKTALGIDNVFYGDQELIPTGITVCVEPGVHRRDLAGSSHMGYNVFTILILVYVSKVQDSSTNRLLSDTLSKNVEHFMHLNLQLNDVNGTNPIVIDGSIIENDPGYTFRAKTLFRSVKMTWQGRTKTRLSQ